MGKRKRRNRKPKYKNPYKTENELCDVFIKYAKQNEWEVYPETSSWDILLVKNGFQVGIQAKLKDNIEVLAQTVDGASYASPDLRVVLVPHASKEFRLIANLLNIHTIEAATIKWDINGKGKWGKEIPQFSLDNFNKKCLTNAKIKCWIPEFEINTPAGVKSPKIITPWKIKAVKLCLKLNEKGFLTSRDFKSEQVSITLWIRKWIKDSGEKIGDLIKYIKRPNSKLPDETYPEIVEAITKQNNLGTEKEKDKENEEK